MNSPSLESLFPRITADQKSALKKLGVTTLHDLLYHFPQRYGGAEKAVTISSLSHGIKATIFGRISKLQTKKTFRTHMNMSSATITDDTGSVRAAWFNQPYIAKMFTDGSLVRIEGAITEKKDGLHFTNPHIESVSKVPNVAADSLFGIDGEEHSLYPVYAESKGITSNWLYHAMERIFSSPYFQTIVDPIPEEILSKYNLPTIKTALIWIHAPKKEQDAEAARKRFAFEEVFFIQLQNQLERAKQKKEKSFVIKPDKDTIESFTSRFSFALTEAQEKSIKDILKDAGKLYPMSRLLEGDVGSGKTAVAATAAFAAVSTNPKGEQYGALQVAYMAPTEILAKQHFESFIELFKHMPISIGLITGTGCRKFPSKVSPSGWTDISRPQFLKWVERGEISIVIGTHALIQKTVKFKNLALVVIDEQHRFGTKARQKLMRKESRIPHLLSMTATPIPRTLALTIYGDLDLSLLDQMPVGRKQTKTEIVLPAKREEVYVKLRKELQAGRQAYVICPKINVDEENKINTKSVTAEAARLKKHVFPEYRIGIMHGKLKPKEKDTVMEDFEEGRIDILVSTSVVEVGVNVPNATSIIIEGAERFGLAQLHQLRGRVRRSNDQSYCYVFTESEGDKTLERLKALETAANGFELSELDLKLRGAGELYGGKQWGLSDLAMEAIRNLKMVEAARTEATEIATTDSQLKKFPLVALRLAEKKEIHFE